MFWAPSTITFTMGREHGMFHHEATQLLNIVVARAAIDPITPIRASSPEFARIPSMLTAGGWERMHHPSQIDNTGMCGRNQLSPSSRYSSTETGRRVKQSNAVATFQRDCFEIYCSNNAFRVCRLEHLTALLRWSGGEQIPEKHLGKRWCYTFDHGDNSADAEPVVPGMKQWLKRIYVTVQIPFKGEADGGEVGERLAELLECPSLEEVTIDLKSRPLLFCKGEELKEECDVIMQLLAEEVLPLAEELQNRVRHVRVKYDYLRGEGRVKTQQTLVMPSLSEDGMSTQPEISENERDKQDQLRRRGASSMDRPLTGPWPFPTPLLCRCPVK